MEYIPPILQGLGYTLLIALLSLLIGAIPGALLFWGKKSKIKVLYWLCTAYIEIFEGIPLLAQLFIVYYALPIAFPILAFSRFTTAIIVLSVNAVANIASISKANAESFKGAHEFDFYVKIVILSLVKEFGKLIKYSSLLSIIGLSELLRAANTIMMATSDMTAIAIAIFIYLILSLIVRLAYKGLKRIFFNESY